MSWIAGVDEAGCGPLAGPVTAASVVLPFNYFNGEIADSKSLTPRRRELLFDEICRHAVTYAVVSVGPRRIDSWNIREATRVSHLLVMKRIASALSGCSPKRDGHNVVHFLIDGNLRLETDLSYETIVKGDEKVFVISAASILAKVTRDRVMSALDQRYPGYGFLRHKGYGTKFHLQIIAERGPCRAHRFSFTGVRQKTVSALSRVER